MALPTEVNEPSRSPTEESVQSVDEQWVRVVDVDLVEATEVVGVAADDPDAGAQVPVAPKRVGHFFGEHDRLAGHDNAGRAQGLPSGHATDVVETPAAC